MTLGLSPVQEDLFTTSEFCEGLLSPDSIYGFLHRECRRLFPDEMFADLFQSFGRRSVPPMIVAVVMVLQRLEGCSDREAVDRFAFDARWKYAAGGLAFDHPSFVHTVLVDMRARLAASEDPERIFRVTVEVAKQAGLVGRRRVLDSTPIYDAVATMDTVTLLRSAIRGVLRTADSELEQRLRAVLCRDDDYRDAGKPVCDWDDRQAREALVDGLAKDARAIAGVLDGLAVMDAVSEAARVLASVLGQDLDVGEDGVFRIARRVAKDRIVSTVDADARHGHKTSARGFDGFKGHVAIDPDSELITKTTVTAGNAPDVSAVRELLAGDLEFPDAQPDSAAAGERPKAGEPEPDAPRETASESNTAGESETDAPASSSAPAGDREPDTSDTVPESEREPGEPRSETSPDGPAPQDRDGLVAVYGDGAYGSGEAIDTLTRSGAEAHCKVQLPTAPNGRFTKDDFTIDLHRGTVICPNGHTATFNAHLAKLRIVTFGAVCGDCPLAKRCTNSKNGRTIQIGRYERQLADARTAQADPAWKSDYTATRPKVERKQAHLMRRKHGGRRARVRGTPKIQADFSLLAAAVNIKRLATLKLTSKHGAWQATTA